MPAFLKTSLSPDPQKTALQSPLLYSECAHESLTGQHLRTLDHLLSINIRCLLPNQSRTGGKAVKFMTPDIAAPQCLALMINKLTAKSNDRFVHHRPQTNIGAR